jgi:serine/threonine protein kinase
MTLTNWQTISPSEFQWEKEALNFIKQGLPTSSLYYAWSNFEFIAENGTISEVDLLVITPYGFYFVEIKSRPGTISGNNQVWTWKNGASTFVVDNPLLLANRKAKKLVGLLKRQVGSSVRLPYLEPLIFCSHSDTKIELEESAAYRVCTRDKLAKDGSIKEKGILSALMHRDFLGSAEAPKSYITPSIVKTVVRAMEQVGIKSSQRNRKVGDYILKEILYENPLGTYKDWLATHSSLKNTFRQIRIYNVAQKDGDGKQSEVLKRAARREYQILENLTHPNILQAEYYTEQEFGPALIFKHDPAALRLDLYLTKKAESLNVDGRAFILRQITEAVKYAHGKKIVHRLLCPQSVWISDEDGQKLNIKVFNWQTGLTETNINSHSTGFGSTLHPEYFVEDISEVYLSPESATSNGILAEHLDIFSLGAIAYHLFSGQPPAANRIDLLSKLREGRGLQISSVIDGAGKKLQELIQFSTHPEVSKRIDSIDEFLELLNNVEKELTSHEEEKVDNPLEAKSGDRLEGGFLIKSRLGSGSSAVAFLVERDGKEFVIKLANSSEHNERLREEAEIAKKLRHPNIVEAYETVEICGLIGYTMQKATGSRRISSQDGSSKPFEGILASRLKAEGRLHLEMLQRFGEDLLEAVKYLEMEGIYHRDIKPDNIGIRQMGKLDELHLVLFDFSLSKTPLDNIRAGTPQYLDWFLSLRKPPRWDLYAERFAVAITLYEMATGELPKWGDGQSNPEVLETEATLATELFDPNLREKMQHFFEKALKRSYKERYDNAVEMLWAWQNIFKDIEQPALGKQSKVETAAAIENASLSTGIINLGLSTLAVSVLDRLGVITVEDLLKTSLRQLYRLRGVGSRTRQEIVDIVAELRDQFPEYIGKPSHDFITTSNEGNLHLETPSVDALAQQIFGAASSDNKTELEVLSALFGFDNSESKQTAWKSYSEIALELRRPLKEIEQAIKKVRKRWFSDSAVTGLRDDVFNLLKSGGGAMTVAELGDSILAARGSSEVDPRRTQVVRSVLRAVIEAETIDKKGRFIEKQRGNSVIFAVDGEVAAFVEMLGEVAEELAAHTPLPTPTRILDSLREVPTPENQEPLSDARLVKLSVALTDKAAVSSRAEIYPVGMPALEALKLAQGTLYGSRELTIEEIRRRVASRYPRAEKMPGRPELDQMLKEAGLDLEWQTAANGGKGAFCYPEPSSLSSGLTSSTFHRNKTALHKDPSVALAEISPAIADARMLENKLRRAEKDGAFLVLQVEPRQMKNAEDEIKRRFDVETINFDELLISAMREQAKKREIDWNVVLKADAANKDSRDWRNLMTLVAYTMPIVEEKISDYSKTVLLTYTGLLGRYDKLDLLDRLRNKIGYSDFKLKGLWLLLATDNIGDLPKMKDKPVPVTSAAQWSPITDSWLANQHRA